MNKSAKFILALFNGIIMLFLIYFGYQKGFFVNNSSDQPFNNLTTNQVITNFEEKLTSNYSGFGKAVCGVQILWQKDVDQNKRMVYAASQCVKVVIKNGDLYSSMGGANYGRLYQLNKIGDGWKIVDYDEREFPTASTKQWVNDYMKLLAKNNNSYDSIMVGEIITKKAAKIFGISTPNYNFKECHKDEDCAKEESCIGLGTSNPQRCVKKCLVHEECGKGYSCRGNGCIPDLPAETLDKAGVTW